MVPARTGMSPVESGRRTYLSERSYLFLSHLVSDDEICVTRRGQRIYQEESISQEGVDKDGPTNPAPGASVWSEDSSSEQCHDDTHELVARVRDEVEQLRVIVDAENVHGDLQAENLEDDDRQRRRGDRTEQLGVEASP